MRGEVEVWAGDELLHKDHNMLCDGAGKTLADIMTVSPSLSGIEDHATSSILDASNYTIQSISFGKGSDGFRSNAHELDPNSSKEANAIHLNSEYFLVGDLPIHVILDYSGIGKLDYDPDPSEKIYQPQNNLSELPNPALNSLAENTSVSSHVGGISVSSVFPGNGQLTNFLPSAIMSSMVEDTVFSSTLSGAIAASYLGCFTEGSSSPYADTGVLGVGNRRLTYKRDLATSWQASGTSFFNEASSMDVSGFVNMVMSSVPNPGYDMSSPASGLTLSANSDFSSNGTVEYSVSISRGDMLFCNGYGGIYSLGLWTIDMQQSLLNGNTPPFEFSVLNNPRKYRLFSRKDLSKNLCHIDPGPGDAENGNWTDLTIKWRLHFL